MVIIPINGEHEPHFHMVRGPRTAILGTLNASHTWDFMNPLVIVGVLAMTITAAAMMLSFSDDQVEYSHVTEQISSIQSERVREEVTVARDGEGIQIRNTGSIPVQIKEIRLLDAEGNIVMRQKADVRVLAAQSYVIDAPDIADALGREGQ